ncbi:Arsenate reductase [Sphingomonas antarctica]|uniref:arsenate reductase (glutaredoxin) n=1 Tax=Sphingomonas antarctica TaxID=2040274 RepID=UPI0039E95ED3
MKATIWHNPACGTSRRTLAILEATPDIQLAVIEYLRTPPDRARLSELFAKAGLSPRQAMRTYAEPAQSLVAELELTDASDETIVDAMMAHPILINRPLVETDKGVRLCRPPEMVHEIL